MVAIGQKTPVLGLDLPKRNFDLFLPHCGIWQLVGLP